MVGALANQMNHGDKEVIIGAVSQLIPIVGGAARTGQFKCRFAEQKATERWDGGASATVFPLIQKKRAAWAWMMEAARRLIFPVRDCSQ